MPASRSATPSPRSREPIAIQYLLNHKIFPIIDTNSDGIITAQEIQNFTDTAATKGLPEAGAMARLLGGTSTLCPAGSRHQQQVFNENPDQPAVLQRRFNYFDYLANGQLKGGITIESLKMLGNTLCCPSPIPYVIVDRQRASANGFLVDPTAVRNSSNLQHLLPRYHVGAEFVQVLLEVAGQVLQRLAGELRGQPQRDAGHVPALLHARSTTGPDNVVAGDAGGQYGQAGGQTLSRGRHPADGRTELDSGDPRPGPRRPLHDDDRRRRPRRPR